MSVLAQQQGLPIPEIAWSAFAPELVVAGTALVLMLFAVAGSRRLLAAVPTGLLVGGVGVWLVLQGVTLPGGVAIALGAAAIALPVGFGRDPRLIGPWAAGLALVAALALTLWQYTELMAVGGAGPQVSEHLAGSVAVDGIALFTRLTVYMSALLTIPIGYGYLVERGIDREEFEPLLLLSVSGMALLGAANDLITLFVALEILSIALYVLAGFARRDRRSQEAGIKYFLNGAVASAILLYGLALLYVATGTLELDAVGTALGLVTTPSAVGVLGLGLVTVGIGFKVAFAPFQLWVTDVYQGSPTNVTGFMAAATKAAAFAAVLRLYLVGFGRLEDLWVPILAVIAAITMMYGALGAIVQRDVKRILAYSSIAHAGYAAIGVVAASRAGVSGTLWYLVTYAVTTLAAFGVVVAIERQRRGEVSLVDLRGLGRTSPVLAGIFALALLSLAGIPPTAGFAGKLTVFQAGVASDLSWLVVIGVVSSVIAAFFYLRLIATMFLDDPDEHSEVPIITTGLSAGVSIAAALVIYLGIQPDVLLDLAVRVAAIAR
ncbi:MAG: NADH-quinone oxidoreductase subunit N [Nitriliruptorales bacterium]|nr:NADH-quinone oxidoreductase subunit N [Nitriliruptorales bacterium]